MNMSLIGIKFKVLDVKHEVEYLLKSGIFTVSKDIPGSGGACTVVLCPVEGIAAVELNFEQPHESRLIDWQVTRGVEITLPCKDLETLVIIHKTLKGAGVMVSDFFDRPWGGQFGLKDLNDNLFIFFNDGP